MSKIDLATSRMWVLGSGGMLGQMVCRYFGGKVAELVRFSGRFSAADAGATCRRLAAANPDIVINCAGAIKQRTGDYGALLYANAVLPLELKALLPASTVLVHPGTDCVFSGSATSPYPTSHPADAEDVYGWSKYLGEQALVDRPQTIVPRVSIIGPDEREGGPGLLNWFLRQPEGAALNGFVNHHWNGITTLEWCRRIETILREGTLVSPEGGSLVQLGTAQAISKHDLLGAFAARFHRDVTITPHAAETAVYRVLAPDIVCRPIEEQLAELPATGGFPDAF